MSKYLYNLPREALDYILQRENEADEYSLLGAQISVLLDVQKKRVKSQRSYSRIWNWSRGKVRHHWDEIWQTVTLWCASHGRQPDPESNAILRGLPPEWLQWLTSEGPESEQPTSSPPLAHEQPTSSPKNDTETDEEPNDSPEAAHEQPTSSPGAAHHTINPKSLSHPKSSKQQQHPSAREADPEPGGGPPPGPAADAAASENDDLLDGRESPLGGAGEDSLSEPATDAARKLSALGVDAPVASELATRHGPKAIRKQIENLRRRQAAGKAPARPEAWLVAAVRHDYDLPKAEATQHRASSSSPPQQRRPARRKPPERQRRPEVEPSSGDGQAGKAPVDLGAVFADIDEADRQKRAAKAERLEQRQEARRQLGEPHHDENAEAA